MEGRHRLARELAQARARTDELFSLVHPDWMFERPIPERHRLNFYLGHVEAFDWNMICRYALSVPAFNDTFDQLFAFGIDPDESGLPTDVPADWPSLKQTHTYNAKVRETVDRLLHEAPEQIVHVAIEHRLMHAETLCYLLHNLELEGKLSPDLPEPKTGVSPDAAMIEIPAGTTCLGRARNGEFGWDNEFEQLRVEVPAFSVGKHKVTNGDYLQFVSDGAPSPFFWKKRRDGWYLRTMFGEIALPLDWPVWVTLTEARSYARARGKSLPSEAQIDRAGYASPEHEYRPFPWGDGGPTKDCGNFNFHSWDPIPVTATPRGDSAYGVSQILGNGWEWTADLFRPLPGFQQFDFYPGYSANFFDDDHYVIKGASPRTAAKLLRRSFRNWFRQGYKYVYCGFRLVD